MRVRMTLHVPLTMPSSASMRLAIRPVRSASMIGIPPPQLASKAMQVLCLSRQGEQVRPAHGEQALVRGDDRFAELQRALDESAGRCVVPPINSMTIFTCGSSIAALASVDIGQIAACSADASRIAHDDVADVEAATRSARGSSSRCLFRTLTTPPPTTPQPSSVMPIVSIIGSGAKSMGAVIQMQ